MRRSLLGRAWDGISGLLRKSVGERRLMTLFPSISTFNSWGANRGELVNHFRGWDYVAIHAICEEVAGMQIQLAHVRAPGDDKQQRAKCLGQQMRRKAMVSIAEHEELEPVSRRHPLLKLLRNPNGPDVAWSFFYKLTMFLKLTGNAYIWMVPSKTFEGEIAELWVIPSNWVRPKSGNGRIVEEYEIRATLSTNTFQEWGQGWAMGSGSRMTIPAAEMIHIAMPSPTNPFDGWSCLSATSDWTDVSNNIDRSRTAHFVNGMFPGVVVQIDKEVADPSPDQIERIKVDIQNKYSGVMRTKQPLVLAPGMTLVPISSSPGEMDYNASADQMKTWKLASHRVGPSVVGLAEQTTFASMVAATASFHRSTINPLLMFVGQVLTEKLCRRYDDELVAYWPDSTPDDPDMKLRKWGDAVSKGCATPNEFRRHVLDLPPFEHGGDDPIVPMGMSPLPLNTGEDPAVMPIPAAASERYNENDQGTEDAQAVDAGEQPVEAEADDPASLLLNGSGKRWERNGHAAH